MTKKANVNDKKAQVPTTKKPKCQRQKSPSANDKKAQVLLATWALCAVVMFANGYEQSISGGAGGIRTRGGLLTLTRFPGVRLKPLIHRS
jgi:hypothetical protein